MTNQQIVLPQESQILRRIRDKFFPQHKLYRMGYYRSLMHCAPQLKEPHGYQTCTGKVDEKDKIAHKTLQNSLDNFQEKYRKNLLKCQQNSNCYEKQLKNFEQTVEKIYSQFYQRVTQETAFN